MLYDTVILLAQLAMRELAVTCKCGTYVSISFSKYIKDNKVLWLNYLWLNDQDTRPVPAMFLNKTTNRINSKAAIALQCESND